MNTELQTELRQRIETARIANKGIHPLCIGDGFHIELSVVEAQVLLTNFEHLHAAADALIQQAKETAAARRRLVDPAFTEQQCQNFATVYWRHFLTEKSRSVLKSLGFDTTLPNFIDIKDYE